MDKRYQVFVSSTFEDLREERAAVTSALLQLDCFPAGMELFPAADDDSLTLIRSVIDDSDYYLVILGGRYGTIDKATGKSYIHLEYEHALAAGKPTIALLHSKPESLPVDKSEGSDEGRKRFNDFRAELQKKHCKLWGDRGELTNAVLTGVLHLKKTRPGVGWIRASEAADDKLKDELLRVRREMDSMSAELEQARRRNPPAGIEDLASGQDTTSIWIEFPDGDISTFNLAWEDIIKAVLPQTFGAAVEDQVIASTLVALARENDEKKLALGDFPRPPSDWKHPVVPRTSFGKVILQMVALGLIEGMPDPGKPSVTRWFATLYGRREGCRLLAERRKRVAGDSSLPRYGSARPLAPSSKR